MDHHQTAGVSDLKVSELARGALLLPTPTLRCLASHVHGLKRPSLDLPLGAARHFKMEAQASLSRDGSLSPIDEAVAQKACMTFPASIRSKVSAALRANHEVWGEIPWAQRLELVKAEAVSLRAASDAAFEALLSTTARPDFDHRDLPSSPDVILSCASSSDDICITLEAVEKPRRSPIHCIIVLDVSGSMDHSATLTAPDASQERVVKFSRLELAKHSSKVIVEVMGDDDSVTIVTFGSEASVQLQKTCMTAAGEFYSPPCISVNALLVDPPHRQTAGAGCHRQLVDCGLHKPHLSQQACPFSSIE
jgi:hypothetical protein